jgi:hypothetical protein
MANTVRAGGKEVMTDMMDQVKDGDRVKDLVPATANIVE